MAEPTPIRSHRTRRSAVVDLVIAAFLLRWRRFEISDDSMVPTLRHGDWMLGVESSDLAPGDVVVAEMPRRPGFLIVKRIGAIDASDGSLMLVADNPAGVDSRRFGRVPVESVRARLAVSYRPWPPRFLP